MRLLVFILLLANAVAFAYFYFRDPLADKGRPALPPLNAERIHLAGGAAPGAPSGAVSKTAQCWEWHDLKPDDLDAAQAALQPLGLGDRLRRIRAEEYWVYIPPLKSKPDALKKLAELRTLNIEGGSLVEQPEKWRNAISFAAYATEEAATVRLNQLKEKGARSAKVLKREAAETTLAIDRTDAKAADALAKMPQHFPGSRLEPIECKAP